MLVPFLGTHLTCRYLAFRSHRSMVFAHIRPISCPADLSLSCPLNASLDLPSWCPFTHEARYLTRWCPFCSSASSWMFRLAAGILLVLSTCSANTARLLPGSSFFTLPTCGPLFFSAPAPGLPALGYLLPGSPAPAQLPKIICSALV